MKKVEVINIAMPLAKGAGFITSVCWELILFSAQFLMPAVHSRWENPRQRDSENVDGNTRLGCSRVASSARISPR